jgi:hypothetical protein
MEVANMTTSEAMARIKRADEVERLRARVAELQALASNALALVAVEAQCHEESGDEKRRRFAVHLRAFEAKARAALAEGGRATSEVNFGEFGDPNAYHIAVSVGPIAGGERAS